MALALTFNKPKLLESQLVGADGVAYYTTRTTRGFRGRKTTTITAKGGIVGAINWRECRFIIDGVQREWSVAPEKCSWGEASYALKYHNSATELVATRNSPTVKNPGDSTETLLNGAAVRYYTACPATENCVTITFPSELRDEVERMFVLMAILRIETVRKDRDDQVKQKLSVNGATLRVMGGYADSKGAPIQGPGPDLPSSVKDRLRDRAVFSVIIGLDRHLIVPLSTPLAASRVMITAPCNPELVDIRGSNPSFGVAKCLWITDYNTVVGCRAFGGPVPDGVAGKVNMRQAQPFTELQLDREDGFCMKW
ncbi:hypothetical protein B0H19DRAFT_1057074 [Mycena capillaripes]|nr:hypothetical protein B0H19DRAFT_1057074 [Mycena capillaripes]